MRRFAEDTSVPISRSRGEIDQPARGSIGREAHENDR